MRCHAILEKFGKVRDIFLALAQGRQIERKAIYAVIEILAESTCIDHLLKIAIGRYHNARLRLQYLAASNALKRAFFQQAQQPGLRFQSHIADLIQKERTTFGQFHLAQPARKPRWQKPLSRDQTVHYRSMSETGHRS